MSRPKGIPKTGGRQKGTENVLTKELRTILKEVICRQLKSLPDELDQLPNDRKIDVIIKLLPFVLPKVENVPIDQDEPSDWGL